MEGLKPRVRGAFSDRNGISKINTTIQKNNLDQRTRNSIINVFDYMIGKCEYNCKLENLYLYIYRYIFYVTKDEMPSYNYQRREQIVSGIKKEWNYDDVFTFLEALLDWYSDTIYESSIYDVFNDLFKKECVGYRFIDGKITDIIDDVEVGELEEALDNKFSACKKSITKALNLLYDRENPDYSNSVKESISAIESMCNIILGTNNATLGDALNKLEKKGIKIHGAMKNAFSSLYGYTSDKSGIRHNGGVDENTSFEEAKYMLVSCSAFLNYLVQIYDSLQ